jgi:hypothetical protein
MAHVRAPRAPSSETPLKKETILELILMDRALSTREKAEALAKAKRLLPGVATLEAGLAAYILGVIQRHTGNDDGKGQGSGPRAARRRRGHRPPVGVRLSCRARLA